MVADVKLTVGRKSFREAHPRWVEEGEHPYQGTWQAHQNNAVRVNNRSAEEFNRQWQRRVQEVSRPRGFKLPEENI